MAKGKAAVATLENAQSMDDAETAFEDFEAAVEEETGKNLGGKDSPDFFNMPMPAMPKEFTGGSQGAGGLEKFDMSELGL